MARYFLLILGSIVFSFPAFSQQQIQIRGKIYDKENKDPVPYVNIINKTTQKGTSSDLNGQFKIPVEPGDTLIFSAIGFSKYSLVITEDLQEVYLEIQMDSEAMELKPVRVFAYRDLESLKQAVVDMDLPADKSEGIGFKLPPAPKYTPEGGGIAVGGAISGLINNLGLNKDFNERKKLNQLQEADSRRNLVNLKYNEDIVREWTGLEGEDLTTFMEFCKISDDFIMDATEYDLAVVVHQCLDDFKERMN